jgi:hyaluronan synthase
MAYRRPKAKQSQSRLIAIIAFLFAAMTLWAIRHATTVIYGSSHPANNLELIYAFAFLMLVWTTSLALLDKPKSVNKREQAYLNKLLVVAIIPTYNEDPVFLERCINSIITQSRKPQKIIVIDDGSTEGDYSEVKKWAFQRAKESGIRMYWKRTENGGKRHAQYVAINMARRADVYLTVDSDGILDREAVKEGLKPFVDPKVKSVAGIVMAINNQKNFLTRFTDLWFVVGQLVDRSSMSTMGSVLVNSGVLAFYDGKVVRKNLDGYINESFFGRAVEFSDDSMLTLYALAEGKAVQQTSSFAFTAMPENLDHHIRQYVRWMRGAFIRTFWRFKYLPLNGYGYWAHVFGWLQMSVSLAIFVSLFILSPVLTHTLIPLLVLIPILVGYGQALFYLTIKRSDETFKSQMLTYATALPAALWAYFVLRLVRWYSIATCMRTGWGTREGIEVKAA